mmetsp:Transcript_75794/g.218858  ORF Transcript_75794/g.218858 Transcript_75794/m.218858 type:complete len:344 (-) Transcript_75794:143-1174(-)
MEECAGLALADAVAPRADRRTLLGANLDLRQAVHDADLLRVGRGRRSLRRRRRGVLLVEDRCVGGGRRGGRRGRRLGLLRRQHGGGLRRRLGLHGGGRRQEGRGGGRRRLLRGNRLHANRRELLEVVAAHRAGPHRRLGPRARFRARLGTLALLALRMHLILCQGGERGHEVLHAFHVFTAEGPGPHVGLEDGGRRRAGRAPLDALLRCAGGAAGTGDHLLESFAAHGVRPKLPRLRRRGSLRLVGLRRCSTGVLGSLAGGEPWRDPEAVAARRREEGALVEAGRGELRVPCAALRRGEARPRRRRGAGRALGRAGARGRRRDVRLLQRELHVRRRTQLHILR